MSQENKKTQPEAENQGEERISWFNTVVPKKKRIINRRTDVMMQWRNSLVEDDSDLPWYMKIWYNTSFQKYLRMLVFLASAFLVCWVAYTYFDIGKAQPRKLPETNTARMVVFPDCEFEMMTNDMAEYPGVIGCVAAYDENGELEGYAYDTYSAGTGGEVNITVGVSVDGYITLAALTSHHEVKGLGTSAGNLFISSFAGRAATEEAMDEIIYMESSPEVSANIVATVKNVVRHANAVYGIEGEADEALQQAVTEDITAQNTFDTPELRALLPEAAFAGFYPDKGYPLKGFKSITMAYHAMDNGVEYRAVDMTVEGQQGDIVMSVAVDTDNRIAAVVIHSQQETAFAEGDLMQQLTAQMIGCDYAALQKLDPDVADEFRITCNVVTNSAMDAISFVKEYMQ